MEKEVKNIIEGISCETCSEERIFGSPPNDNPNNKYIYLDLSGKTRCFCKKHMSYCNKTGAILNFNDDWEFPCYGAKLISEIIKNN